MTEVELLAARLTGAFHRGPADGLRADIRAEFARIFGMAIGGTEETHSALWAVLPLHLALLTDPHLYRVRCGFIILDHPVRAEEFAWALKAQVHDGPTWWSLYADRHPRLIAIPDKGREVPLANVCGSLTCAGFHGPWEKPPTWEYTAGTAHGFFRSIRRVEHTLARAHA
jgi:hypothetical protein